MTHPRTRARSVRTIIAAALAGLLMQTGAAAWAARVSPMIVSVAPSGRGATTRVELTNPAASDYPVEAQVFKGLVSEAGELQLVPADEDFMVFPPQTVVPAKSQQVFRVQYLGEPDLKTSELYYLQIRQVPVKLDTQQTGVQFLVNFNVLLNVVPQGSRPQPVIESVRPVTREVAAAERKDSAPASAAAPASGTPEGNAPPASAPAPSTKVNGIEVRVGNSGTRFFNAGMAPWEITGKTTDGEEVRLKLPPETIVKSTGVGVVAPGRTRVFFVPTPALLAENSVQVRIAP